MVKKFSVRVIIRRRFLEKAMKSIPKKEISSGPKKTLQEAVEKATEKAEKRLKEMGLWGHLYVAFKVEEEEQKEMEEILNQLGWKEMISYRHKKGNKKRENGWLKK